ncbi:hypothetical protein KNT81_gp178 [Proteus phage phiP4-3]|uniref:Uncharacterized protein n=1 Tax=Proteus phage phiP4-3 TaxID=2065203 RepID=A0A2I6PFU1_9CAUD|nr:hypothetical protein KNT81_gp178 [Proteus phage phiP4-3]AUM58593.1 hypothetical protein phiP43_235 [Proteus phage phiP4-3]
MMYQENLAQLICDSEVSKFKRYNKGLSDFIVKSTLYEGPETGKIVGK